MYNIFLGASQRHVLWNGLESTGLVLSSSQTLLKLDTGLTSSCQGCSLFVLIHSYQIPEGDKMSLNAQSGDCSVSGQNPSSQLVGSLGARPDSTGQLTRLQTPPFICPCFRMGSGTVKLGKVPKYNQMETGWEISIDQQIKQGLSRELWDYPNSSHWSFGKVRGYWCPL